MVRVRLSPDELRRGERLGELLRTARGEVSMVEVARRAAISVETLRKIESGRIATPAFFTIAALTEVLGLRLDDVAQMVAEPRNVEPQAS